MPESRNEQPRAGEDRPHIVESYDRELAELRDLFLKLGDLAHRQVMRAVEVVTRQDRVAAARLVKDDGLVDDLAGSIQKLAFQLLALRQPASVDLRLVLIPYKATSNLERIADYATNIAKRSIKLEEGGPREIIDSVARLGQMTGGLVHDVLTAFRNRDGRMAFAVRDRDEEADALYISIFRELLTYMTADQGSIARCTHILFVIKNFERIGEHATAIAEYVNFLVTGELPAGGRHMPEEWVDPEQLANPPQGR